jgi:hypothetical protein
VELGCPAYWDAMEVGKFELLADLEEWLEEYEVEEVGVGNESG